MKTESRERKATRIFSKTGSIRKITRNHYVVESQSSDKTYNVQRLPKSGVWTCECRDFHYRLRTQDSKYCKHIQACIILQDTVQVQNRIEKTEQPQVCPKCSSTTIIKRGFRKLKNGTRRQKYGCKQCERGFILGENGFSKISSDPKIISECLNLVMSGVSYRNVARHIYSTHEIEISHVSVRNWIKKYTYSNHM